MAIAGIWRDQQVNQPPSFTMLTTAPGPDVEPIHNRQIVVLQPENWKARVYLTKPENELLRPLPAGSLCVETVWLAKGSAARDRHPASGIANSLAELPEE